MSACSCRRIGIFVSQMIKYNGNKLVYKEQVIGKYVTQNRLQLKIQVICIGFGLTIIHHTYIYNATRMLGNGLRVIWSALQNGLLSHPIWILLKSFGLMLRKRIIRSVGLMWGTRRTIYLKTVPRLGQLHPYKLFMFNSQQRTLN